MSNKPVFTVHYEESATELWAYVRPGRGLVAASIGGTKAEARRNVRMAVADLLDCGDFDFALRDAREHALAIR